MLDKPTGAQRRVLVLLSGLAAAALMGLPWLSTAPNRLVSGQAVYLVAWWQSSLAQTDTVVMVAAVMVAMALLVGLSRFAVHRWALWASLALALALIPGLLGLAGMNAAGLAETGSSVARTALGSGFWAAWLMLGLLVSELLQGLRARPLARAAVMLVTLTLVAGVLAAGGGSELSLVKEFNNRVDEFWAALARHVLIVAVSLGCTLLIGLPLGALGHCRHGLRRALMPVLNVLQTIPSIALFGLLIAPLAWLGGVLPAIGQGVVSGIGLLPAVIALTLYGLLPVVRGVLAGLAQVPQSMLQASRSLGLSGWQTLRWVALPLALPVVLAGVRTAAVQGVGLAAVAALIGAGGLGAILFEGLFSAAQDVVVLAVLPLVGMGMLVDGVFSFLQRLTRVDRVRALTQSQEALHAL